MMPFCDLSEQVQGVILTLLAIMFLLTAYVFIRMVEQRVKWWCAGICGVVLAGMYALKQGLLFVNRRAATYYETPALLWLGEQAWSHIIAVSLVLCGVSVLGLVFLDRLRYTTVSMISVKECIDCLPAGLCFHTENGRVLMANEKMEQLCIRATGRSLLNANDLWDILKRGEPKTGVSAYIEGNTLAFICEDGNTFGFERQELRWKTGVVYQLTAVDITDSYHLSAELGLEVERLRTMNERLKNYSGTIAGMIREEEILQAKVSIHDRLGRALISGGLYIQRGEETVPSEELLWLWRQCVDVLRYDPEPDAVADPLGELSAAAALVGVRVVTEGVIPRGNDRAMRIMISGAMECVNNAAHHAGAEEVTIVMEQTPERYWFSYKNDGAVPAGNVTEGGGLSGLRRRVEQLGGTMTIRCDPQFILILSLPKEV